MTGQKDRIVKLEQMSVAGILMGTDERTPKNIAPVRRKNQHPSPREDPFGPVHDVQKKLDPSSPTMMEYCGAGASSSQPAKLSEATHDREAALVKTSGGTWRRRLQKDQKMDRGL